MIYDNDAKVVSYLRKLSSGHCDFSINSKPARDIQGQIFILQDSIPLLNNNNNYLLISSAQVSTIRFSNARYKEQNNLNMCTI